MKERPILFSGPMVRAILDGRKTQTRRIVREELGNRGGTVGDHVKWFERGREDPTRWCGHDGLGSLGWVKCPYGEPDDRLWVRETHAIEGNYGITSADEYPPPFSDGRPTKWDEDEDYGRTWKQAHYAATDPKPELVSATGDDRLLGWRPSIHMPRWASRLELEVTGVRVERLHDLTNDDAKAEGITDEAVIRAKVPSHRDAFRYLWDDINGHRESWASNPWVWVVEFRVVLNTDRRSK